MFIDMAENDINTVYVAGSNDVSEPTIFKNNQRWRKTGLTLSSLPLIKIL